MILPDTPFAFMTTVAPPGNHPTSNHSGRSRKSKGKHPSTGAKKAKYEPHKGEVKSSEEVKSSVEAEAPEQHAIASETIALLMAHFFSPADENVCVLSQRRRGRRPSRSSSSSSAASSSSSSSSTASSISPTAWQPGRRLNCRGYAMLVERVKQADRFLPDITRHPAAFHYNINAIHTGDLSNASITFPRSRWCKRKDNETWVLLLNYPYPNPCKILDDIRHTAPPPTVFTGAINEYLNDVNGWVQKTMWIAPHPIPKFYCSLHHQITMLHLLYQNSTTTSYTAMVRLLRASPTAAYQPCIFPLLLHVLNRGGGTGRTSNRDFSTGMSALDAKFVLLLVLYSPLDACWCKRLHGNNKTVKYRDFALSNRLRSKHDWTYFHGKTTRQLLWEVVRVNPEYEPMFGEFLS